MSKVLLINGSPHEHGCTDAALTELADALRANGVETENVWIGKKPVAGCIACHKCAETGKCVFQDQTNEIGARIDEFDGIVRSITAARPGRCARLWIGFSIRAPRKWPESWARRWCPVGAAARLRLLTV